MTDVPKIVRYRLQAGELGRPEQTHPEADALVAFAENALSQAERDSVLGHLAKCGGCREVVALALPAEDATPVAAMAAAEAGSETTVVQVSNSASIRRAWFAWANLRWAALAAGVAVALFVMRPGLERLETKVPKPVTAARMAATPANPAASETAGPDLAKKAEIKPEAPPNMKKRSTTKPAVNNYPKLLVGRNFTALPTAGSNVPRSPQTGALALGVPRGANEVVESSGAATEVTTTSSEIDAVTQNQVLAVEKAKPAPGQMAPAAGNNSQMTSQQTAARLETSQGVIVSGASPPVPTLKQGVIWSIKAGVLQRSFDGGAGWQVAVRADHTILCYAVRDQEIWAGGEAGTVLHSADNGTTWINVQPLYRGQPVSSDVIRIEARDSAHVTFLTVNHETWSSSDGGKTWEKK